MTEDLIIFIYNIFLIVIYTCASMSFFLFFVGKHKKAYLAASVLFLCYILDNIVLYMAEFISDFSIYYDKKMSGGSVYKTLLLAGICLCYLFIKSEFSGEKVPSKIDWAAYAAAVLCIWVTSETTSVMNVWIYYTAESVFIIYLCCSVLLHNSKNHTASFLYKEKKSFLNYFLIAAIILSAAVIIEDAVVLLGLTPDMAIAKRVRQRNAFEDIISVVFVIYAFYIYEYGRRKAHKVQAENIDNEDFLQEANTAKEVLSVPYIPIDELDLSGFAARYGLTKRETQVLKLLLEDKSNQEMQEILVIASGTVKNHIHNIYQKTGVSKRGQLVNLVCEFTMQ